MPETGLSITPTTKVGELLDAYPQLEALLIDLAPPFKKLKNPVLRRTVAKITTLQQAAQVGNVPLETVINTLREATGQSQLDTLDTAPTAADTPAWFDTAQIVHTIDARPILAAGDSPLVEVMQAITQLESTQILELVTPFVPAPLIERAEAKGLACWSSTQPGDIVKTYFTPA